MDTVLITGCSSDIGRATARAFLEADWRVIATARQPADIDDLSEAGCETEALDVTDDQAVDRLVHAVGEEVERIDAVVNNAGYGRFGPLEDLSVEEVHRQFDVNVYGPHRIARALLPTMREQGDGVIINLSSNLGRLSVPGAGAYCASKFALEAMSDALRAEVDSFGVDVVVVEPGPVVTSFVDQALDELEPDATRSEAYRPIYRLFDDAAVVGSEAPLATPPDEVAETILEAAEAIDPAPRYTVGSVARWTSLARFLPDRWRDAGFQFAEQFVDSRNR